MPDTITVALITAAGSVLGSYFINLKNKKEEAIREAVREEEQAIRLTNIEEQIKTLSKQVAVHNGYAEKFGGIKTDISLVQQDICYIKEEIKDLKKIPMCKLN